MAKLPEKRTKPIREWDGFKPPLNDTMPDEPSSKSIERLVYMARCLQDLLHRRCRDNDPALRARSLMEAETATRHIQSEINLTLGRCDEEVLTEAAELRREGLVASWPESGHLVTFAGGPLDGQDQVVHTAHINGGRMKIPVFPEMTTDLWETMKGKGPEQLDEEIPVKAAVYRVAPGILGMPVTAVYEGEE